MPESSMQTGLSQRLRTIRKRRGFTQGELAKVSGVSKSLISKLEQEVVTDPQTATLHKLAIALRTTTSELLKGSPRVQEELPIDPGMWEPVERARHGASPGGGTIPAGDPEPDQRAQATARHQPVRGGRLLLPYLIRDIDALDMEGRAVRSRILNITGWLFVQMRQFERAESPIRQAIDAAEDRLDAAAAVATLAWMYLRAGQLNEARELAIRWADDIEPRFSRAPRLSWPCGGGC